jgi:hypothetical protein
MNTYRRKLPRLRAFWPILVSGEARGNCGGSPKWPTKIFQRCNRCAAASHSPASARPGISPLARGVPCGATASLALYCPVRFIVRHHAEGHETLAHGDAKLIPCMCRALAPWRDHLERRGSERPHHLRRWGQVPRATSRFTSGCGGRDDTHDWVRSILAIWCGKRLYRSMTGLCSFR